MTWSYYGAPGTGSTAATQDAVRFLSGQTSSSEAVVIQDEEIAFLLMQGGSIYNAAAMAAEQLAGRYAGKATSKTVGDLSVSYQLRGQEYRERARTLRANGALRAAPYAGGIAVADKQMWEQDTTRVTPNFAIGQDDNRRSTGSA